MSASCFFSSLPRRGRHERETNRFFAGRSCGQTPPSCQPGGEGLIDAQTVSKESRTLRTQDTQVSRRLRHVHRSRLFRETASR